MQDDDNRTSISNARTLEEMADFWDTHSTADYDDQTYEVNVTFAPTAFDNNIKIESELMFELWEIAQAQGISVETLVNVWLRHDVDKTARATRNHVQVPVPA